MNGALQFGNYLTCMAAKIIVVTSMSVLELSLSCYLVLVMFKCKIEWGVQFSGCDVWLLLARGLGRWAGIEGGSEWKQ